MTAHEQLLHSFDRTTSDGGNPMAGLVFDSKGNLYGTTLNGGPGPGGIVFRLAPPGKSGQWNETVLYGFDGYKGAYDPESNLIFDQAGNLYGTTNVSRSGAGDVFRLSPGGQGGTWVYSRLYGFTGPPNGAEPAAALVFDKAGNLYSTTTKGGNATGCQFGCGAVFEVEP